MNIEKDYNLILFQKLVLLRKKWDIHSILLPEENINFEGVDLVELWILTTVLIYSMKSWFRDNCKRNWKEGKNIERPFGHVRLTIKSGQWFAKQFSKRLRANKVLVQKSGYFGRSSKPNQRDLNLILNVWFRLSLWSQRH